MSNRSESTPLRRRRRTLRETAGIALCAALICVLAPLSVPIGVIPVTLGLLGVLAAAALTGPIRGSIAVTIYLALGLVGVPVFSGYRGGAGVLFGPTGGFLVGYLLCAPITGLYTRLPSCIPRPVRDYLCLPLLACAGIALCYAAGTAWYAVMAGVSPAAALAACVLPFLPFDALKILVTALVVPPVRRALTAGGLL